MKDVFYRPLNWQDEFTKQIHSAITSAGSKSALARAIGVNYATITSWLRGACPSDQNIRRVDEFLNGRGKRGEKNDRD